MFSCHHSQQRDVLSDLCLTLSVFLANLAEIVLSTFIFSLSPSLLSYLFFQPCDVNLSSMDVSGSMWWKEGPVIRLITNESGSVSSIAKNTLFYQLLPSHLSVACRLDQNYRYIKMMMRIFICKGKLTKYLATCDCFIAGAFAFNILLVSFFLK